jgi:hypothetical protein
LVIWWPSRKTITTSSITLKTGCPGITRKPRHDKDANDPETFFALLEKTGAKIETIDTAAWHEAKLTRLNETVTTLRERLDARFPVVNPRPSTLDI